MRGKTSYQRLTVLAFVPILVTTAPCASEAVGAEPATTLEELTSSPSVLFDAELFQPDVEGQRSFILKPRQNTATTNRPWVWYAPTLLADNERVWRSPGSRHAWMFKRLLAGGVYVAGVDVGESYGSPKGRSVYQKFYQRLVRRYGFSAKPVLLPISRGGLMAYNWAAEHPDCVGGIGAVYPVCNLRTYPPMEKLAGPYGMSTQQLESQFEQHNPLARLAPACRGPCAHPTRARGQRSDRSSGEKLCRTGCPLQIARRKRRADCRSRQGA